MNRHLMQISRLRGLLLLALTAAMAAAQPEPAAEPAAEAEPMAPPAVQVVVFLDPQFTYQAAIAYDRAVPREQVKQDLVELAQGLGYDSVNELRRWLPGEKERRPLGIRDVDGRAQAEFRLSERAFNRQTGTFKIEPFIDAFREYGRIDLDFFVGELQGRSFAYRGIGNFENRAVRIRHRGEGMTHSFQVQVLDPNYTELDLPPFAPPEEPLHSRADDGKDWGRGREYLLLAAAAVTAAVLMFLMLQYTQRRQRKARRRR